MLTPLAGGHSRACSGVGSGSLDCMRPCWHLTTHHIHEPDTHPRCHCLPVPRRSAPPPCTSASPRRTPAASLSCCCATCERRWPPRCRWAGCSAFAFKVIPSFPHAVIACYLLLAPLATDGRGGRHRITLQLTAVCTCLVCVRLWTPGAHTPASVRRPTAPCCLPLAPVQDPSAGGEGTAPLYGMAAVVPDRRIVAQFLTAYQDALLEGI